MLDLLLTSLFDWISLLFMGFVFIISSLVILYSDDYVFGDLNIIQFISLVLLVWCLKKSRRWNLS